MPARDFYVPLNTNPSGDPFSKREKNFTWETEYQPRQADHKSPACDEERKILLRGQVVSGDCTRYNVHKKSFRAYL